MNDTILTADLFQTLGREHRLIQSVLDGFERYLAKLEAGTAIDRLELGRFVTFFREYVDLTHHEREERVLFPLLVEHGFAESYGPLAHIRDQHGKERGYLWELMRVVLEGPSGGAEAVQELRRVGLDYVEFQRAHIEKEARLFYPAARRVLTFKDLRRMQERSARFEKDPQRANRGWLTALGASLATAHAA